MRKFKAVQLLAVSLLLIQLFIPYAQAAEVQPDPEMFEGFAGKQPVYVYASPAKNAKIIKTYAYGDKIAYRNFSADWHATDVTVNGKVQTGYIAAGDVGQAVPGARGIALNEKTNIYSQPSVNAKILKTYPAGTILNYQAHDAEWFRTTVDAGGKRLTGYIYRPDVETIVTHPSAGSGFAAKIPTNVYASPSAKAKVIKTYKQGSPLQYHTFTSRWHEVTVVVSGKKMTGYVSKGDVGDRNTQLSGYAVNNEAAVYSQPSVKSQKLKTYKKGTLLKYKVYNASWFQAVVYVNGKAKTGYIQAGDVGAAPTLKGLSLKNPTRVYSKMSRSSKVLKAYAKGLVLTYKPVNNEWHQATVTVNGKKYTGYIAAGDVKTIIPTGDTKIVNPYQVYSYNEMVRDIEKLYLAYPELISYKVIGKSEYGRPIYAVALGKGKAAALIHGSHHAREWLTTNLNMYMIEQYAKAYYKKQKIGGFNVYDILNAATIWFIPMVNPDGVTLQQEGLKAFPKSLHKNLIKMNKGSKNFKRWKANAKGVDLNRQYNAGWKTIKGSPSGPMYKNFKGYKPESAAEVKAVLKLVREVDPEMAVAYHSSGKIIYWNYLQTGARYKRDHEYAKKLRSLTGYRLVYPKGVPSGGGFTDWFIQAKKRPGFTIEICKYVYETNPPVSEFKHVWKENQAVGLYVALESAKLAKK